MKILSILTNILLSILIVLSGSAFVTQTLTQTSKIQDAAKRSGVYKGISEVVSKELTDLAAEEAIKSGVANNQDFSKIVDEAYVTAKGEQLAQQIEDFRSGKSNSIVLDISDIAARAKAQGLNVDEATLKPIEIVPPSQNNQPNNISGSMNVGQIILYSFTALLFIASIIFSIIRRNLFGLFLALLISGITLLSFALFSNLIGTFVANQLSLPAEVSQLNPYVRTFTKALLSDASKMFLIQGLGLVVISIITAIIHKFIRKPMRTPTDDIDQPTPEKIKPVVQSTQKNSKN